MKNRIYTVAFVFILMIGFANAITLASAEVQTLGTFKQNADLNLIQNGAGFDNCTITSVLNPASAQVLGSTLMVKTGNFYNTSFSETSVLGSYVVSGFCTASAGDTVWAYDFKITETGEGTNTFPIQLSFLVFGFIMMITGKVFSGFRILKYGGGALTFVMGILTIFPGYAGISGNTLLGLTVGTISIGIGFFFMIEDSFSFDNQVDHYDQHDDGRFVP